MALSFFYDVCYNSAKCGHYSLVEFFHRLEAFAASLKMIYMMHSMND